MIELERSSTYRRSIKETLLLLLCSILAVAVTVLAYIRMRDEHWTLAFVDVGIVCIMLLLFLFVYVSRRTRTVGILIALGFISAALMATLMLGVGELYWAFPALMVAYFMLDARQATILTGGFVGCFLAIVWDDFSAIALTKICITLITTVLLANAFSLTNRRQLETLRRMANVDPLTGVGNRRAQNQRLDTVIAMCRRSRSAASLLILDIDHFKRINDAYGHMAGDQLLVEICALVQAQTRASESLYRYGGEEFVVVTEQTPLDAAVKLAEKIRKLIAQEIFSSGIQLTVSIGVAELQPTEDREAWLGRADAALYRAKGRGRDQVVVAAAADAQTLLHIPVHLNTQSRAVRASTGDSVARISL